MDEKSKSKVADVYHCKTADKESLKKLLKIIKNDLKDEKIGIKIHFGDENNTTHIDPKLMEAVKEFYKEPYYIESNVLYKGRRTTEKEHIRLAREHGFTNIPIVILDGELGMDILEIPINQKHIKVAKFGTRLREFDQIISMAHFKGHMLAGFGGAIKNVAMGMASRTGKLEMHSSSIPIVMKNCIACGICAENCEFNAIDVAQIAIIDDKKCVGCSRCIAICPHGAIMPDWSGDGPATVNERLAEYMLAITKTKKMWYINFLINMTKECDCMSITQKPFIKDLGIVMSKDPVAVDKASLDLIRNANGKDPFKEHNGIDSDHMIEYAQKIGVGTMRYKLIEI